MYHHVTYAYLYSWGVILLSMFLTLKPTFITTPLPISLCYFVSSGPVSFARPVVPARPPLAAVYKGAGAGRCWLLCVSESYLENTEQ